MIEQRRLPGNSVVDPSGTPIAIDYKSGWYGKHAPRIRKVGMLQCINLYDLKLILVTFRDFTELWFLNRFAGQAIRRCEIKNRWPAKKERIELKALTDPAIQGEATPQSDEQPDARRD